MRGRSEERLERQLAGGNPRSSPPASYTLRAHDTTSLRAVERQDAEPASEEATLEEKEPRKFFSRPIGAGRVGRQEIAYATPSELRAGRCAAQKPMCGPANYRNGWLLTQLTN